MRTVLPLGEPPIIGYQHHAFPLSISSLHPLFKEWFYSNYIQLVSFDNAGSNTLDYNFYEFQRLNAKSPFLGDMYIHKSMLSRYADLLQFTMDALDDGQYIITFVNEFYVPNRRFYKKNDFIHDILIYGYDSERQVLHTAGFNENFSYGRSEIGFKDFLPAFTRFADSKDRMIKWADGMHLYQLKPDNRFSFDPALVAELLEDYLDSRNTSNRFRMYQSPVNHTFGLATYDHAVRYLETLDGEPVDMRIFHIMYEHKKVMAARFRYMAEEKGFALGVKAAKEYSALEEMALTNRNLSLKMLLKNDRKLLGGLKGNLRELQEEERKVLARLVPELKRQMEGMS